MLPCDGGAADRQIRADHAVRGAAGRHRRTAGPPSRCSPADCPTAAATAWSRAPAGSWKRCRSSGSTTSALESLARSSTPTRWTTCATSGSAATSTATPRASCTSPGSPVLSVHGTFAECVLLETLALSILNHDSAIASAAARMVSAAEGRPLIEMGSRRTHEQAAVAARTRRLHRRVRRHLEPRGAAPLRRARARHQRARLHDAAHHRRRARRAGRVPRRRSTRSGVGTTLLVDTYDVTAGRGQRRRGRRAPNSARCASTPAISACWPGRCAPNSTGSAPPNTSIVVSGDLDEYSIAALRAEPVDTYGVGTSLVTGSGAPTAGMVYKLVEVDGMPVQKRSSHKESHGGRKQAMRLARPTGTIVEEVVHPVGRPPDRRSRSRGADGAAGARRRAGGRRRPGRRPERVVAPAGQPAVGGSEALARRTRDPDPSWSPTVTRASERTDSRRVTELLAAAVAALGGSERTGQVAMAEAVAHAFDTGEHLAVQAGTGTGKSLAYLVPCDRASGDRRRTPGRGVHRDHRAATPARRPRPAPAGRRADRRAAPPARASRC